MIRRYPLMTFIEIFFVTIPLEIRAADIFRHFLSVRDLSEKSSWIVKEMAEQHFIQLSRKRVFDLLDTPQSKQEGDDDGIGPPRGVSFVKSVMEDIKRFHFSGLDMGEFMDQFGSLIEEEAGIFLV